MVISRICFILMLGKALLSGSAFAQTISGNLSALTKQPIKLEGFDGLKNFSIDSTISDETGNFKLAYSKAYFGVGYLMSADNKPLFVILSGEDIEITGEALSNKQTLKVIRGRENQWFEQYATEHPLREQALSAWGYLERIYSLNASFTVQKTTLKTIQKEKQRIKAEDATFLSTLPKESYVSWFLPTRKLVSSVSAVAQYRTEEIPETISAFRNLDYTDARLYKSGLLKDAIESHFWLLENSGKPLDSVFIEMKNSIDAMMVHLLKDEKKLNEVTGYLFDLLERHSLFQASEHLALKVLNETSCTLDSDLAKQLESYRTMKKGNSAPDISFVDATYLNGVKQNKFSRLADLATPYILVVFGASWCPHCVGELPKLKEKYSKWRQLGVEVVYVSLDTEKQAFEQEVKSYPFFAYCDYKKWESQVVKDYYVFGTPTFYILNNKREILQRPNSIAQVDAWIDWFLLKGNK